ncbi:MAG: hypothetical protein ACRDLR_04560 [Gaiellaceae bacterium]
MTGGFDEDYYIRLERRVSALIRSFEHDFARDQIGLLVELADHNEPGVAVEMLSSMLVESARPVASELRDEFRALAETMHLKSDVWSQLRVWESAE